MEDLFIGNLHISRVEEMYGQMPMKMVLPDINEKDIARLKTWYWDEALSLDIEQANMRLSMHSYILRVDGLNILIDSCNGNHKARSIPFANDLNTEYMANFAKHGLSPDDIDIVMCTHLHADHVGWNTKLENGKWVPTFNNARYLFGRKDMDFFKTQTHEIFHKEAFEDSIAPIIEAGKAELVDDGQVIHREIEDGIWLEQTSGHSPGCLCIHAKRGGSKALFTGDAFHHPIQLIRPDAHFFADEDPALASQTRTRLMNTYADTDTIILPAHFTGKTACRILNDGDAFKADFIGN